MAGGYDDQPVAGQQSRYRVGGRVPGDPVPPRLHRAALPAVASPGGQGGQYLLERRVVGVHAEQPAQRRQVLALDGVPEPGLHGICRRFPGCGLNPVMLVLEGVGG